MTLKKLIVTNKKALVQKYGSNGFSRIQNALSKLSTSDKNRSITNVLVFLDDQTVMTSYG